MAEEAAEGAAELEQLRRRVSLLRRCQLESFVRVLEADGEVKVRLDFLGCLGNKFGYCCCFGNFLWVFDFKNFRLN